MSKDIPQVGPPQRGRIISLIADAQFRFWALRILSLMRLFVRQS
jgi:hypothetical protein